MSALRLWAARLKFKLGSYWEGTMILKNVLDGGEEIDLQRLSQCSLG